MGYLHPTPSAEGLHVGHVYTYCGADTYGRFQRMRGRHVFQPMGFDSFGIHTQNFALKVGQKHRSPTSTVSGVTLVGCLKTSLSESYLATERRSDSTGPRSTPGCASAGPLRLARRDRP